MTLEELIAERERLLVEKEENNSIITSCRAQIDAARSRAMRGVEPIDQRWIIAAKTRARYAGRRDQELAGEIREIRKRIYDTKQDTLGYHDNEEELLNHALQLIHQALDIVRAKRKIEDKS